MTRARDVATQGGLVLLNTTTFSAQSTVSIDNVFSATYDKYIITFLAGVSSGGVVSNFRLRTSGTDNTASSYNTTFGRSTSLGTFAQVTSSESGNTVSTIAEYNNSISTYQGFTKFEIVNPFQSFITNGMMDIVVPHNVTTFIQRRFGAFSFNATTSFDGFSIICASAQTGTIQVYGYKK
jgi:hypothetical protein